MSEMRERVKAAIAAKLAPAIDVRAPYAKVMFEEAARAAIAAMREPTEATVARVALAIEQTMFAPHEMPLSEDLHAKYLETARAALGALVF